MGDFAAETQKPTWLYSNSKYVHDIECYKTQIFNKGSGAQVCDKKRKADGSWSVSGGKRLKATQTYPEDFGEGMSNLYIDHRYHLSVHAARVASLCQDLRIPTQCAEDLWADANLHEVLAQLA